MSELESQIRNRRAKLAALRDAGVDCFPRRYPYDLEPAEVESRYGERSGEELERAQLQLRVPGRVRAMREHGKTVFLDLIDGKAKLQVMVRRKQLDTKSVAVLDGTDLGDYLGVSGSLLRTRTGELTLEAAEITLLAKALRPLPEKWHGLADTEARYRQRYLDLLGKPESRRVFEVRAAVITGLRRRLDQIGFLEVETPVMQALPGGAAARPFVTHHEALDLELYLRIAPELFLKRLLVGGFHRVYELGRVFRNEGISTRHNPEFTMLEFYWAYADYTSLMDFTESLVAELAAEVTGEATITWQGRPIELTPPWPRYTMRGAIAHFAGIPLDRLDALADLAPLLAERGVAWPGIVDQPTHPVLTCGSGEAWENTGGEEPQGWYGHCLTALFEATVEEHLQQPTFITEFPVEISPLAKPAEDPRFTERFELYIGGMEIVNAFTELNDPDMQAERFRRQLEARERGDGEAHRFDEDFVRALEHGMPPAGGEGIGIDRLTMLLTDTQAIRDVILFPLLRPERESPSDSE